MIKNKSKVRDESQHFNIAYDRGARINDSEAIYKGLKFFKDGRILKTDTDFYRPLDSKYLKIFDKKGFDIGIKTYLCDKYLHNLKVVQDRIRDEIAGENNHRRLRYMKTTRENLINKYNEINNQ